MVLFLHPSFSMWISSSYNKDGALLPTLGDLLWKNERMWQMWLPVVSLSLPSGLLPLPWKQARASLLEGGRTPGRELVLLLLVDSQPPATWLRPPETSQTTTYSDTRTGPWEVGWAWWLRSANPPADPGFTSKNKCLLLYAAKFCDCTIVAK